MSIRQTQPPSQNEWALEITSSLPSLANFTIMGWFYLGANNGASDGFDYTDFFLLQQPTGDLFTGPGSKYIWVGTDSVTHKQFLLETYDGTTYTDNSGASMTFNNWYHVVLTVSGNTYTLYYSNESNSIDCVQTAQIAATPIGLTLAQMAVGIMPWAAVTNVKAWTEVLSQAQMRVERDAYAVTHSSNLYLSTPLRMAGDYADTSGNGNNWSLVDAYATLDPLAMDTFRDPQVLNDAGVTQIALEGVEQFATPKAQATQIALDAIEQFSSPSTQIIQIAIEVIRTGPDCNPTPPVPPPVVVYGCVTALGNPPATGGPGCPVTGI